MLRKQVVSLLSVLTLLVLVSSSASADRRDFWVYNKGTEPIYYLHVSHISEENWGSDIMAADEVLMPDERIKVKFSDDTDLCHYDVQAVYKDGDKREKRDENLCEVESVEFYH